MQTLRFAILIAAGFGLVVSIVMQFAAEPVVSLFTDRDAAEGADVIRSGGQYLRGYISFPDGTGYGCGIPDIGCYLPDCFSYTKTAEKSCIKMKRTRDFGKEKNSGVSFSVSVFMRICRKSQLLCKLYRTDFPAKRSVDRWESGSYTWNTF